MPSPSELPQIFSTAVGHHQAGRLNDAAALYRQILAVEPKHGDTLYFMGRIDYDQGRLESSEDRLRKAVAADPTQAVYHCHLAQTLRAQRKFPAAIVSYLAALKLQPEYANAHLGLAGTFHATGSIDQAENSAREALRHQPEFPEAHLSLGLLYKELHRFQEAHDHLQSAIQQRPTYSEAQRGLGDVLRSQGKYEESIAAYRRAIDINPNDDHAYFSLGVVQQIAGRPKEALVSYRRAVQLKPDDADSYTNMGIILEEMGDTDKAIEAHRKAIELWPQIASTHGNLGVCLASQGRPEEALASYRKAIELAPDDHRFYSNMLYTLLYHPTMDAQSIFAEHRQWGQRHADPLTASSPTHKNDRTPGRRLRLGYVSGHFRSHAVTYFSETFLSQHDHQAFEVYFYSNVPKPHYDATTERLRPFADQWRDIEGLPDAQVNEMIRQDQIDILVDLAGHIAGERLLLFAHKPAPVQVTYLGYQATTGMLAMDYRLTDAWSDPAGETDQWHTEKLVRLPRTFFSYRPFIDAPPVEELPLATNGYITFGSFNNFAKVTPQAIETWARVMQLVPNSKLVFLAAVTDSLKLYLQTSFQLQGIAPDRLTFYRQQPLAQFLIALSRVDIAFDPFPFNGHTTTCDALWMGVPVISLAGDTYVSRFGSSALATLDMQDCITRSPEEYVQAAVNLAHDRPRLTAYRQELRDRFRASALCDEEQFTRAMESAYQQMWTTWLQDN